MRHRPKPLLVAIAFVALLTCGGPAKPAGCPQARSCAAMHGGPASCAAWRSDSGCCHLGAPVGQIPSEAALGGPAAAPPFLLAVVVTDSQTCGRLLSVDDPPAILRSHAPPLYLLHASFLN